jgi:hypothetical protein
VCLEQRSGTGKHITLGLVNRQVQISGRLFEACTVLETVIVGPNPVYDMLVCLIDLLCGLAVRVPGYRSRDPGSFPGAIRCSER